MSSATTKKTMYNENEDMLAVLIGGANIIFSIISHWFKSSTLKYLNVLIWANVSLLFGLAVGGAFLFVGTQMRGKERAQPLLVASLVMLVFFFGRFWASPVKEIFPSGILAALRYLIYKSDLC
jgi:Transmembrane proteins 14C